MGGDDAPKIDRKLDLVLREREVRGVRFKLDKATIGAVLLTVGIFGWSLFGVYIAALAIGAGLFVMRSSVATGEPAAFESVTRRERVRVSAEGIRVGQDPVIPRSVIAQAYYQPRRGGAGSVRCLDAKNTLLFEAQVRDSDEAHEILQTLGGAVGQRRAHFRVAGPVLGGPLGGLTIGGVILGTIYAAATAHGRISPYLLLAAIVPFLIFTLGERRLEVGVDGLLVQWLFSKRFIGYDALETIESVGSQIVLHLRSGEKVRLSKGRASGNAHEAELATDALFARIQEARRVFNARASGADLATKVSRGAREVAEWRADLLRLHDPESGGSYRDLAARGEDLWRVVEDTTAPEDARAGAAVVLRKEDGAGPRLRIAADAVASPKLRIALEKASDPAVDEEALDEALAAFEREKG